LKPAKTVASIVNGSNAKQDDDQANLNEITERKRLEKLKAKQDKLTEINHEQDSLSLKSAVKGTESKKKKKQRAQEEDE
jgi:hypothetical protein